jgi:hypothetical protein
MNPQSINILLLIDLLFILLIVFRINWIKFGFNRLLVLSFSLAVTAKLLIEYGSHVESFNYGLNYFTNYEKFSYNFFKSYIYAAGLVIVSFCLFFWGLSPRAYFTKKEDLFNPYLIVIVLAVFTVATAFISILIVMVIAGLLAWTGIPIVITGITIFCKVSKSNFFAGRKKKFIYLLAGSLLIAHSAIPWLYPTWLKTKYQMGFEGGFSEALENQMDITAIHQWLSMQDCSKWVHNGPFFHPNKDGLILTGDYQQGNESYQQLPLFIRQLNPIGVGLVGSSCDVKAIVILILYYHPGFGLAIISPHPNSTPVTDILYDFSEMPISDECNCYIIRKGWS